MLPGNATAPAVCCGPGEPRPPITVVRTKVRRLYDIANVLATLGLLERCMTPDKIKPAYRWLHTPDGAQVVSGPLPAPLPARQVPRRENPNHLGPKTHCHPSKSSQRAGSLRHVLCALLAP